MPAKNEAYCVKCKAKTTISNAKLTETKNGQPMLKGSCPKCGTTVCRFVPKK